MQEANLKTDEEIVKDLKWFSARYSDQMSQEALFATALVRLLESKIQHDEGVDIDG